jgi:hypothetical protein
MSYHVTFHSPLILQSYAIHLNVLTNIYIYSVLKSRAVADWLIENMNPDVTPNRMLLNVCVSPEIKCYRNVL